MESRQEEFVRTTMEFVEVILDLARLTKGWSDEVVAQQRAVRRDAISQLTPEIITREQERALCSGELFVADRKFWVGMGGAAGYGSGLPYIEPDQQVTIYGEILEDQIEASTSSGVGKAILDITVAIRRISDPAVWKDWWTDKGKRPPAQRRVPWPLRPLTWLSSWLNS